MKASRRFPDFYILGAPKAGTSSLAQYLDERGDVFVSDPKEPRYFADDFADRPFKDQESYLDLFDEAPEGALLGEGTTDYLVSKTAVDRILDVRPDAKFIAMLRNPVQIVVAMHAQERKNGYETLADPKEAWAAIERRKSGTDVPRLCNEPKRLFYDDRCRLGEQVKRLKDKVAPEQLMIIFMDDFARDTSQIYRQTLAFLGLDDEGRQDFPVVNSRHHIKHPAMIQLWKLGTSVKNKLGLKTNFGVLNKVQQVGLTSEAAPESGDLETFRQELRDYFYPDIDLLGQLTDRDLSGWLTPK
ncbi:MAG: sulfotransferase family protein [Geminicoccaceae bacterium]